MRSQLLLALALSFVVPAFAQSPPTTNPHPVTITVPSAAPKDVESIDAIIAALYDVISGPAGQARDWNRMRSLFIPGARMMPAGVRAGGEVGMRLLEVNDYIAMSGELLVKKGFSEHELARRTEQFGHIAHVFSTYEGRMATEPTVLRGINSIQLLNDGKRWWVVSVFWEAEHGDLKLPQHYLPGKADTAAKASP
ncbi:hypothetical protein IP90_01345 [Luteimonas cucumeris]|uniref:SnoaL-like protein n=1 Tax=Luteimonas cucumeris TaxID=985012 RepID=A0A562L7U9_9GAMM|nr:hypothetical protein [Luteimonas cucumeris]TWI03534.1 hypothetical protein IP90_01345 [Luteimonas cucumeris]